MSAKLIPLDISKSPELERLVEEMERSGVGRVLVREGEEVAVLTTTSTSGRAKRHRTPKDPRRVLDIIGRGASSEPSDIAHHKDEYIADSIRPRSE